MREGFVVFNLYLKRRRTKMVRTIFKLVLVLFVVASMTSVVHATETRLEQGGMTRDEVIGAGAGGIVGAGAGIGTSVVAISATGTVTGLNAAGIASGLAAIGGGSMIGGVIVTTGGTAIVVLACAYGGYKVVQWWQTP
jgi:hypothetical protein